MHTHLVVQANFLIGCNNMVKPCGFVDLSIDTQCTKGSKGQQRKLLYEGSHADAVLCTSPKEAMERGEAGHRSVDCQMDVTIHCYDILATNENTEICR